MLYFVSAIMDNPGEEPSEVKTADGFDIPFPPEFKKRKLSTHNAGSSSFCVREAETNPEDRPVKDDRVSRSAKCPVDWSKCFICKNKTHKKVKELISVCTFDACQSMGKAAESKGDEDMLHTLRSVSDDLTAVEAKYHKNCFALYVTKKTLHHHANDQSDSPHERAFREMTKDISQGLDQGKAYDMGSLLTRYREILEEKGVQGDSYTTQRLKVRLEKPFGDSVVFHQQSDKTKPELLYSSSIQVQDVLNGWVHLKKAKERGKGPDEDATKERDIARVASYIKVEMRKCKGITSRPLDVKDISQESTREVIPDSLYWLIRLIISPDDNRCLDRSSVFTNMVDERQVLSIAQDVIHCCTNGRVKLPKQTSLAMCVFT